jgi:MFS family permease
VRETHGHALHEAGARVGADGTAAAAGGARAWLRLAWRSTIQDPSLSAASQAGLVNNLNDGLAWGLFPILWATAGLDLGQVGLLAAAYPATWGVVQVATGGLSDRIGRKPLIVTGLLVQAVAIAAIGLWSGVGPWLVAAIALGLGTAMVYPTLLAVVTDVADPRRRGAVTGVYRFWRDVGFAVGAVLVGVVTDRFDARAAILLVAALTALSGLIVAVRMRETRPRLPAIR